MSGREFLHKVDKIPAVQVKLNMADTRVETGHHHQYRHVREKGAAGMAKVNTATLLDYCKKEGIKGAKAKSKMDELVRCGW